MYALYQQNVTGWVREYFTRAFSSNGLRFHRPLSFCLQNLRGKTRFKVLIYFRKVCYLYLLVQYTQILLEKIIHFMVGLFFSHNIYFVPPLGPLEASSPVTRVTQAHIVYSTLSFTRKIKLVIFAKCK